jgi:hypothetical protein
MNKTIYVRDEDAPVWDRAKELAGDKLSPVIMDGLKRFVTEKEAEEAEMKGFERIVVRFNDSEDRAIPKAKAFNGKWIFPPTKPFKQSNEQGDNLYYSAVALTAKGAAVFYTWEEDHEGRGCYGFTVFPSLEDAAGEQRVKWAAIQAMEVLGVPVEELDI